MNGRTNAAGGGADMEIETFYEQSAVHSSPWTISTSKPIKELVFMTDIQNTTSSARMMLYPYSLNNSVVSNSAMIYPDSGPNKGPNQANVSVSGNEITLTWSGGSYMGIGHFNITVGYIPA